MTINRIKNPVEGIARDVLCRSAGEFAIARDLLNQELLFKKGAMVGQRPHRYIQGVSPQEHAVIDNELARPLAQRWLLRIAVILVPILAGISGWTQASKFTHDMIDITMA